MSNVKDDFGRKFPSHVENGPSNGSFVGKVGSSLHFGIVNL